MHPWVYDVGMLPFHAIGLFAGSIAAIVILALFFAVFVAPVWIIAHYLTRWRMTPGIPASDEKLLGDLWEVARRMNERLENLERATTQPKSELR